MSVSVDVATAPPADWNRFVDSHGSFYHRAEWVAALGRAFRYRTWFVTARESGAIAGVLPLAAVPTPLGGSRLVSLPFSYAAGPLTQAADVDASLCAAALELAGEERLRAVEVKRRLHPHAPPAGFTRTSRYRTYIVPTEGGTQAVWERLHPSHVQRGIRKGEKQVSVDQVDGEAGWRRMAELQQHTARRLGVPAPPDAFFTRHCAALAQQGLADCLLARAADGTHVAGIVLWRGAGELIYAFGASLPRYWDLRPNHALLWAAAQRAVHAGVPFDLGRAAPEQEGLTDFKLRWGGEPVPLAYDFWPRPSGLNARPRDRGALAVAARSWSRLPLAITRRASFLYRYLG